MPRTTVDLDCQIEHLSILDADGSLDSELEPEVDDAFLETLHRAMLAARRFDEEMLSLQRQGRLGTFAPVRGQEAAQLGAICHLCEQDWMIPSYRETAAMLWRGTPMSQILLFNAGFVEGAAIPEGRRDLPTAVPVGTQMLHAAGIGYGLRALGEDSIAMTFFGDGATSEGDFHEALNMARVFDCPTVFVCENNQYAISTPRRRQTASKTLAQKGMAYDVPSIQADGNDVLAVFAAVGEAVERARHESRPSLVECVTYRLEVHTTVDDPGKYRDASEVERWERRDPLPRFQRYLRERGVLDDASIEELEGAIQAEIGDAVAHVDDEVEALSDPETATESIFAHLQRDMADELKAQRRTLEARSE